MRLSNRVILASQNRHKFEEFLSLLASHPGVELIPIQEIVRNADKLGLVETHDTYLENALAKARLANMGAHYPCLADDSGLEVQALEGKPGARSRRYAPPKAGLSQDEANNQYLLKELSGAKSRVARFVCTLALVVEGVELTATGLLEGTIADAPRGKNGFGYDPLFIPKGSQKTLAEMTDAEKNTLSHRAKAVSDLMAQVRSHDLALAKP